MHGPARPSKTRFGHRPINFSCFDVAVAVAVAVAAVVVSPPTLFCSFRSCVPSLLHSFVRSSVCSSFTLFIRLIVRPFIRSFVHSLVSSFFEATLVLLLQRNLIGSLTFE
jgi:hypothetical protein